MINNDLISKVREVVDELDKLEKHYRIQGSNAYEIDDPVVFQAVQLDTYNKMREIREWKTTVLDLSAAISQQEEKIEENQPEKTNTKPSCPTPEPIEEAATQVGQAEIEEREIIREPQEEPKEEQETQITLHMFNETYPLKYWSAVLVKVCQVILITQPFVIARLSQEKSLENPEGCNFSYIKSDIINSPRRLHNGLWIELDRTAEEVLEVIDTIKKMGGYNENDITVDYE